MRSRLLLALVLLVAMACAQTTTTAPATQARSAGTYDKAVLAFEARDKQTPPPANPTLFIGSSTFTRWRAIPDEFKEFTAINRAFGGSTLADQIRYADRTILPYKPKTVVIYCGTNDVAGKMSPEKVQKNFETLAEKIHAALPETQIYFISAIPAPTRIKVADKMDELNVLAQKYIAERSYLHYIDARYALSGPDKQPDEKLYGSDRLHPNEEGYKRLIPLIKAALGTPPATAPAK